MESHTWRMRASGVAIVAVVCMAGLDAGQAASAPASPAPAAHTGDQVKTAEANYGKIPLSFEANVGQTDPRVQFLSRGSGYSLFLAPGEVVLSLERQKATPGLHAKKQSPEAPLVDTLRMNLAGANTNATVAGLDPQAGVVSSFIGNDPKKWHTGIKTYGKVNYAQVYPGVDLVFYGNQRQLEYDFVVAPGADAGRIAWQIDGAKPEVDAAGDLQLHAANGPASFKKPVIYQMDGDRKRAVEGAFLVAGNQVRFKLGSYDRSKPLIIDPVLSYASYLGGSIGDYIGFNSYVTSDNTTQGLAVDKEGSVYVTGFTYSDDFPLEHPYEKAPPVVKTSDGRYPASFVSKFSPDGTSLVYSTYLGGSDGDYGSSIAVDANGEAYVTGYTYSPDFPITAGAFQTVCGANWTEANSVFTRITNCGGGGTANTFVTKLNAAGTGLVYSTFLGGDGYSEGMAIAVDADGRAYVAGIEGTVCGSGQPAFACFPTTAGAIINGGDPGGDSPPFSFVSVFDPTGATLLYSTIFGDMNGIGMPVLCGSCLTYIGGIAVDANENFYLTGATLGAALPTTLGVVQPTTGPLVDNQLSVYRGFVFKFNALGSSGSALAYGTYLGGHTAGTPDWPTGIAVDAGGNAYITGETMSSDFPVTKGAYQTTCWPDGSSCPDKAFVAKLNSTATAIDWATYFGDVVSTTGNFGNVYMMGPVQLDGEGNVYITGQSTTGMPVVNPILPGAAGEAQQFIAEFDPTGGKLLFSTYLGGGPNEQYAAGLAVDAKGDIYAAGTASGGLITTKGAFQTSFGGGVQDAYVLKIAAHGIATVKLSVTPSPVTPGEVATLTATVAGPKYGSAPTGTVTFKSGSKVLENVRLSSTGTVTCKTPALSLGSYIVTAKYSGDSTYPATTSAALDLNVAKIKTSTTLTASPNPAFTRVHVTFTAKVAAKVGSGIPFGSVTFMDGTTKLSTVPLNSAEIASFSTASLAARIHSVTAVYEGNARFVTSTSNLVEEKIEPPVATTTALAVSATSVAAGASVTFTAKVKAASGSVEPAGTVTFWAGTRMLGKGTLSKTGAATFATSTLAQGQHSIKADYSGDAGDLSSVSSALTVTVTAK